MAETLIHRVGARINNLRLERKLTLAALSKRTGVNLSFLTNVVNAKQFPSISTLERIAKGLKVDVKTLLDFPEPGNRKSDRHRDEIAVINSYLERAELETVRKIRRVVEVLVD